MYYSIQSPAFLKRAFQTKPDSRHFSASLLGRTQLHSHTALAVLQMAARVGQCRHRERERVCVFDSGHSICIHLKALLIVLHMLLYV